MGRLKYFLAPLVDSYNAIRHFQDRLNRLLLSSNDHRSVTNVDARVQEARKRDKYKFILKISLSFSHPRLR